MNYESVFDDYIETHNLSSDTFAVDTFIKDIGYLNFFNDITRRCLGEIKSAKREPTKTSGALVYMPNAVKDKLVQGFDVVYVTQLYYSIIAKGDMKFNYPNYEQFLRELVALRIELKKRYAGSKDGNDALKNILIKIYMNTIYGMLDKPESLVHSQIENPREFVIETSKKVMLTLVSFFLNKSMPIYYMDTDEIFVPHMDSKTKVDLTAFFEKECREYIDTTLSTVTVDDNERNMCAYILAKKKLIRAPSHGSKVQGLDIVNNDTTLLQNKKFFGRNYKDVFPEYALWA